LKIGVIKLLCFSLELINEDQCMSVAGMCVQKHLHRHISDFENHLDDPTSADYWNEKINTAVQRALTQL